MSPIISGGGGGGGGGGGVSFSTATATVTANQGNGYSASHTFDLGDGPHVVQITLTGLTLTGDGETFGNDAGMIYAGPNSGTTRLASSADGLVFGNVNSPNEIGPQATGAGGATFEIQTTSVTAKAVTTSGRYLKVPLVIASNDTGDIYAGANHPSAQVRIDLRYL